MKIPKSIETYLELIHRKDETISIRCREIIYESYVNEDPEFWFYTSILLRYVLKSITIEGRGRNDKDVILESAFPHLFESYVEAMLAVIPFQDCLVDDGHAQQEHIHSGDDGESMPASSEAAFEQLRDLLIQFVPQDGNTIGNKSLIKALEQETARRGMVFSESLYWEVRDGLISEGVLMKGQGRGGSVFLVAPLLAAIEARNAGNSMEESLDGEPADESLWDEEVGETKDIPPSLDKLRKRLLDLSARNRLLNFQHGRGKRHARVIDELPDQLFSVLMSDRDMRFEAVPEPLEEELLAAGYLEEDPESGKVREARKLPTAAEWAAHLGMPTGYELPSPSGASVSKHQDRAIQTLYFAPELETRLQGLHTASRTALEESGANVLYLAMGFLEWEESNDRGSRRLAPLMLLPVRLERGALNVETSTYEYRISYTGEEIFTNLSLRERLKQDFGIALPTIAHEMTPEAYFNAVASTVLRVKPDWQLRRFASLGIFEFAKLMMFLDLDPARWPGNSLLQHALLGQLMGLVTAGELGGAGASGGGGFSEEHAIDQVAKVHEHFPLIDDADSSQHSAIIDAIRGENLVIEGPPGTGKSQTITNLIAAAMAQGKRVLFVAEKLAALEVVKNRLARAGLEDFCLELHSHKIQKSVVIGSIGRRLQSRRKFRSPADLSKQVEHYERLKGQLNQYVSKLHAPFRATGLSGFEIFSRTANLATRVPMPARAFHPTADRQIDCDMLAEQAEYFSKYYRRTAAEAGEPGRLETHPWYGLARENLSPADRETLLAQLGAAELALRNLKVEVDALANLLVLPDAFGEDDHEVVVIAKQLQALPQVQRDEDWSLVERLDLASAEALKIWLDQIELHAREYERLTQLLSPEVLVPSGPLADLLQACATVREHTNTADLMLDEVLVVVRALPPALEFAPHALGLMGEIRAAGKCPGSWRSDAEGLRQLKILLELAEALPHELVEMRSALFDDARLDELLHDLSARQMSLKAQRDDISRHLSLGSLPDVERLEDLHNVLADASPLRWFKSGWRQARDELKQLGRPGIAFKNVAASASTAVEYLKALEEFKADRRYLQALGDRFQSLDTDTQTIEAMRAWYRKLRECCGVGFGPNVWIADWLTNVPAGVFLSVAQAARNCLQYLVGVDELCSKLHALFPFDQHALTNDSLLNADGYLALLHRDLEPALACMLSAVRIERPSLGVVISAARDAETWLEADQGLQASPELLSLTDGLPLPHVNDGGVARKQIASWRHTLSLIHPIMALPMAEKHLEAISQSDAAGVESMINGWRDQGERVAAAAEAWLKTFEKFAIFASIQPINWWASAAPGALDARIERLVCANRRADLLDHWFEYRRFRNRLCELGFEAVVKAIEDLKLEADRAADACQLGLLDFWAVEMLEADLELAGFTGREHEAIRERFVEIDEGLKRLQRESVAWKIDQADVPLGINSGRVKERTELALLEHETGKQRRHESVRTLMQRSGRALQALMPCFMMSPMAVAQYLPAGKIEFDLVIMDEASQMRPEEALGSIARGKQLVVVGDPKQLAPTSFFARQSDDAEDEGDEASIAQDAESILDAAMPLFKLRRLRWHYRSRHESLIAFSNSSFYDGNLVIYPSPQEKSSEFGVFLARVPRGRFVDGRNVDEAEHVARAIEHHLLNSPHESLGVVAMNIKQADQIERILEQRSKDNPALEKALFEDSQRHEPLFIKNLENVQGDERDVIYISFTYGPVDVGGRVPQRFGPVTNDGGWRRLNVLFTRSKKRMHVFSSFGHGDVEVSGTTKRGVKALRDFLEFAESGRMPMTHETNREPDSDFEIAVRDALSRHGYECEMQVGVAGFFIDIAVRDPGQRGRYLMGIECDGAPYHSSKSARDRDRLRQSVLEQLGWKIRRIWSPDWYRNPNVPLAPILRELEELKTAEGYVAAPMAFEELAFIEEDSHKTAEHFERVSQGGNEGSLRDRLERFDSEVIRIKLPNTPKESRLLRDSMLEALLNYAPASRWEFVESIPKYLREGTDPAEAAFLDEVLSIIAEA